MNEESTNSIRAEKLDITKSSKDTITNKINKLHLPNMVMHRASSYTDLLYMLCYRTQQQRPLFFSCLSAPSLCLHPLNMMHHLSFHSPFRHI